MNTEQLLSNQQEIATKLEKLLTNFKKDSPTRKTPEYLNEKQAIVNKLWEQFSDNHDQLKVYIKTDHPYITNELYKATSQLVSKILELIENSQSDPRSKTSITKTPSLATQPNAVSLQIGNLEKPTLNRTNPTTPTVDEIHNLVQGTQSMNENFNNSPILPLSYMDPSRINNFPKLPPIKIPKFDGEYKNWKPFIDIFTNVINNNPYLSNVEKMQYLLYHLEGDAKKVINHLQLSNDNYNTALRLIEARFNNNRKIITTYIYTIMDLKKVEFRSQNDIIMLHDALRECLEGLKNLKCNTDEWGPIIVCIITKKLDPESLRLFEEGLANPREMPTITELLKFLEKRYQILDYLKGSRQIRLENTQYKKKSFHTALKNVCAYCNKQHVIYQCMDFKKLDTKERNSFIMRKGICLNCLSHKKAEKCKTNKTCFYCKKKHHTLLHYDAFNQRQRNESAEISATSIVQLAKDEDVTTLHNQIKIPRVLLPTAMIRVSNIFGQTELLRAIIDPGSQVSLITEESVQNLKLQKQRIHTTIMGVSEAKTASSHNKVSFRITLPYERNSYLRVEALVLPKLSSFLPETELSSVDLKRYGNITLADPSFDKPGPIDVLLGADVYANVLLDGIIKHKPTAQNTKLGWILFGNIPNDLQKTNKVSTLLSLSEIDKKIEQFWDLKDNVSTDDAEHECADHFANTHKRDENGRYIVRLPFKTTPTELGFSKDKAIARLLQVEKRLQSNPVDAIEYNKFLMEYLELGHMSLANTYTGHEYYLPHHAVFKRDSTTTKLRVVFDGSCKTKSGLSLNDILHVGPKVQQDLDRILLRWRKYRYVFTADIEKMFRQIQVAKEDRDYQRILWRKNPQERIKEYVLNTVTYGTAPATYLAIKVLKQLAEDEGHQYPIAKEALRNDFYVDDLLTGTNSKLEARELQKQLIALLKKDGFNLRKWTSNCEDLLRTIPEGTETEKKYQLKQ